MESLYFQTEISDWYKCHLDGSLHEKEWKITNKQTNCSLVWLKHLLVVINLIQSDVIFLFLPHLQLPALCSYLPTEDINPQKSGQKTFSLIFQKGPVVLQNWWALSFLANVTETAGNGAFVRDYFQRWIDIHWCSCEYFVQQRRVTENKLKWLCLFIIMNEHVAQWNSWLIDVFLIFFGQHSSFLARMNKVYQTLSTQKFVSPLWFVDSENTLSFKDKQLKCPLQFVRRMWRALPWVLYSP